MADLKVQLDETNSARREFAIRLLRDLHALEEMQARGLFESGIRRIGAEQEFCLVDSNFRPSIRGPEILAAIAEPHFTSELARYTLEINLDPQALKSQAFTRMQVQLDQLLDVARACAAEFGDRIILTGILPSIGMSELDSRFLTPAPRYQLLEQRLRELRGGGDVELAIQGIDDLMMCHDNILFEACNTSFQVHLQIDPANFVDQYNWAQAISGPVMSIAVNSPMLFGRELWAETRIALFQQSVDTRSKDHGLRQRQARVYFGNRWLRRSISEIFEDDIARFPLFLSSQTEDSLELLSRGEVPSLKSLALHNGTIWKWNRPCFGSNGKMAHLRLENRYLPSGPTTRDEIANAAFWIGLMCGMPDDYRQLWKRMDFQEAKENFLRAAQHGLDVELTWLSETKSARRMILDDLLPLAWKGLESQQVDMGDITKYLGIIEQRAERRLTGAKWLKLAMRRADPELELLQKQMALTAACFENEASGRVVAEWPDASLVAVAPTCLFDERVDLLMTTDLITVAADDLLELVRRIMRWREIRHVPVEDKQGEIVGLITENDLVAFIASHSGQSDSRSNMLDSEFKAADVMVADPICVSVDTSLGAAKALMIERGISCLPVTRRKKLVGLITKVDILRLEKKSGPQLT